MKTIKKITIICCLLFFQVTAIAQITPSVYVGGGLNTNLGGRIGIGTEVQYKNISVNAAIGGSFFQKPENHEYVGDNPYLGFDVGVKYYFYKGLFGGVNYGVLGKDHDTTEVPNVYNVENCYGFSFTVGYKLTFLKRFYGMTYLGITSREEVNRFFGAIFPRFGLILGYNLIF